LILAVSDIDEIIELIKKSPDAPTAKQNLMKKPLKLANRKPCGSFCLRNLSKKSHTNYSTTPRRDFDNAIAAADGA
jgi:DNA gyrase/topoisomerase IV subunit A